MKMPKIFQGKKSKGQAADVSSSRSSSMEKSPSSSQRGVKKSDQTSLPKYASSSKGEIEEVVEARSPFLSAQDLHEKELTEAFRLIDVNKDGHISRAELGVILQCLGEKPTEEELRLMVAAVDADGDGQIDLQEFINLNKMTLNDRSSHSAELRAAFCVFDIDRNNQISAEELHQVLRRLGEQSLTMEECCRMIKSVDSDGDGFVNFEEFEKMMSTPVY